MRPSLVAHGQLPKAVEPGERAFHHPAVLSKAVARLDALARNPRDDASLATGQPAESVIVALVRMQLGGPLPRSAAFAAHRHDRIQRRLKLLAIMDVGRRQRHRERDPGAVGHHMALAARFAAIRRIRAGGLAPLLAGTLAESSEARDQSSLSAACRRRRMAWCSASQTPASCQSRSRRQQVIPLPQPISCGSISQGMPLCKTNKLPVSNAAAFTRRSRCDAGA
jgi:hypothetical protein